MNEASFAVIGLILGGLISWLTTNARLRREVAVLYDRALMDKRLKAYVELWAKTKGVPRSRLRGEGTGTALGEVRANWHDWYYGGKDGGEGGGGIFMSEAVRVTYFKAITSLEDAAVHCGKDELTDAQYRPVYDAVSALRDQMTEDVGARLDLQAQLKAKWPWSRRRAMSAGLEDYGPEDYRKLFDDHLHALEFQHTLINRKITWLLTSQTILFAALGLTLQVPNLALVRVVAGMGLILCVFIGLGLLGNVLAKWVVHKDYRNAEEASGAPARPWRTRATNRIEFGVRGPLTWLGITTDLAIPLTFAAAWMIVLVQGDNIVDAATTSLTAR